MPRMKTNRDRAGYVVFGPCPGCDIWTLEYSETLAGTFGMAEFSVMVEQVLADHLQECPGLREIVDTLR